MTTVFFIVARRLYQSVMVLLWEKGERRCGEPSCIFQTIWKGSNQRWFDALSLVISSCGSRCTQMKALCLYLILQIGWVFVEGGSSFLFLFFFWFAFWFLSHVLWCASFFGTFHIFCLICLSGWKREGRGGWRSFFMLSVKKYFSIFFTTQVDKALSQLHRVATQMLFNFKSIDSTDREVLEIGARSIQ